MASALKEAKTKEGTNLQSVKFSSDVKGEKVPKGAEILKNDVRVDVEEIENGFLIVKNYDIKYTVKGESGYAYYSKKWFSETNPLAIDTKDSSLADLFD